MKKFFKEYKAPFYYFKIAYLSDDYEIMDANNRVVCCAYEEKVAKLLCEVLNEKGKR